MSEPVIEEHGLGQYQILVQLPGVDDPARVKEIMQSTAMLEIRQVARRDHIRASSRLCRTRRSFAAGYGLVARDKASEPGNPTKDAVWYLVSRASAVTGRDLREAEPSRDENGQPAVQFNLTNEGGRRFAAFTGAHVGDNLAVVLDNKVQEVAVIKEQIHDTGVINGRFTEQAS